MRLSAYMQPKRARTKTDAMKRERVPAIRQSLLNVDQEWAKEAVGPKEQVDT
jgi:hypothetical protein